MFSPKKAKKYSNVAILCGVSSGFLTGLFFSFFGEVIINFFTSNEEIKHMFMSILPYIALHQIFDHIQTVENGVLKGIGKQKHAAIALILIMFSVGLPLAYYLAFDYELRFTGAYLGVIGATALICLYFTVQVCCFSNWEKITGNISSTAQSSKEEIDMIVI